VHRRRHRGAQAHHHVRAHRHPAGGFLPGRRRRGRVVQRADDRLRHRHRAGHRGCSDALDRGRRLRHGGRPLQPIATDGFRASWGRGPDPPPTWPAAAAATPPILPRAGAGGRRSARPARTAARRRRPT
jgi:hypothetical protein